MSNIIIATPDGRVDLIKRQYIKTDNPIFRQYIAVLAKNLEASEETLTDGFNTTAASNLTSPLSLIKYDQSLDFFVRNFLLNRKTALLFLSTYYTIYKNQNLPATVTVLSTKYSYSPLKHGGFKMKVIFMTDKTFIDKQTNKLVRLKVPDTFIFKGVLDPSKYSTINNPYGLKLYDITLGIYTYSNYQQSKINGGNQ